jgi:cytochrome oxidase Cu insertion factor (SCO1/SenC/PrrC family)
VVQQYGASSKIVPTPQSAAKYTIAHTTTVFCAGPAGRVRNTFDYDAGVGTVMSGIREILAGAS